MTDLKTEQGSEGGRPERCYVPEWFRNTLSTYLTILGTI